MTMSKEWEGRLDNLKITYSNDMGTWKGSITEQLHPDAVEEIKSFITQVAHDAYKRGRNESR